MSVLHSKIEKAILHIRFTREAYENALSDLDRILLPNDQKPKTARIPKVKKVVINNESNGPDAAPTNGNGESHPSKGSRVDQVLSSLSTDPESQWNYDRLAKSTPGVSVAQLRVLVSKLAKIGKIKSTGRGLFQLAE
jgi:hypothetical protein